MTLKTFSSDTHQGMKSWITADIRLCPSRQLTIGSIASLNTFGSTPGLKFHSLILATT